MRRWVFAVALALTGAFALMLSPPAGAQPGSLTFDPSTGTVVSGSRHSIDGTTPLTAVSCA